MITSPFLVLVLFTALAAALPLQQDLEVSPLGELSDGSALYLVRHKRQNFRQYPGGYPGQGFNSRGRPQRPGGFQGGFQQPSFAGSAANAQAQGFQAGSGPGAFGATHAGTQTQGFAAGPGGITGSAGQSFSQNYNLPGGISATVSGAGSFGAGPGGVTQGGGSSVSFTGPNGQPIRG